MATDLAIFQNGHYKTATNLFQMWAIRADLATRIRPYIPRVQPYPSIYARSPGRRHVGVCEIHGDTSCHPSVVLRYSAW